MHYKYRLVIKKDTYSNWYNSYLIPLEGEPCYDIDNRILKIGDGIHRFMDIPIRDYGYVDSRTFNNNLSFTDDTLQKALETIDDLNIDSNYSELEKITEDNLTGWRLLGTNPDNYSSIGLNSIDLSISSSVSSTFGASGTNSFSIGHETTASGDYSSSLGVATLASGDLSLASGDRTISSGYASQATGSQTLAEGSYSASSGNSSSAIGLASHAEGKNTEALGSYSHTEGYFTEALGSYSHAEGINTQAFGGGGSHAEGDDTIAMGLSSHSEGVGTIAQNVASHSQGKYNIGESSDTIYEIGIGLDSDNRKNALELYIDGKIIAPELSNDLITNPRSIITKEYLESNSSGGESSQLEKITEDGNTGWRILGRDALNYGNIGLGAIDLSFSNSVSDINGAINNYNLATGYETSASLSERYIEDISVISDADIPLTTDVTSSFPNTMGLVSQEILVPNGGFISAGLSFTLEGGDTIGPAVYAFDVTSVPLSSQSSSNALIMSDNWYSSGYWDALGDWENNTGEDRLIQIVYSTTSGPFVPNSISLNQYVRLYVSITNSLGYAEEPSSATSRVYTPSSSFLLPDIGATFTQGIGTKTRNPGQASLGKYNTGSSSDTILEVGIGYDSNNRVNALEIYEDGKIYAPGLSMILQDNPKSIITKEYVEDLVLGLKIEDLVDVDTITLTPIEGQFLKYDGVNWVPETIVEQTAISRESFNFDAVEAQTEFIILSRIYSSADIEVLINGIEVRNIYFDVTNNSTDTVITLVDECSNLDWIKIRTI